jgi:hypothetical protein
LLTKYAKPQWTSRFRSDNGSAERRMGGDIAHDRPVAAESPVSDCRDQRAFFASVKS